MYIHTSYMYIYIYEFILMHFIGMLALTILLKYINLYIHMYVTHVRVLYTAELYTHIQILQIQR